MMSMGFGTALKNFYKSLLWGTLKLDLCKNQGGKSRKDFRFGGTGALGGDGLAAKKNAFLNLHNNAAHVLTVPSGEKCTVPVKSTLHTAIAYRDWFLGIKWRHEKE